ncbi:MAG: M28 family peptidase [Chloroflexota bacterium]|nr:M28 family peptidase [Chloroflexota bacterium]
MRWLTGALTLFLALVFASCADSEQAQPARPAVTEQQAQAQKAAQGEDEPGVAQEAEEAQPQQADRPAEGDQPDDQESDREAASSSDQQGSEQDEADFVMPDPSGPDAPAFDFALALDYLTRLVEELGPRATGTDEERAAAAWIAEELEGLGYEVEIQEFSYRAMASFSRIDLDENRSLYGFRFPNSGSGTATGTLVDVPGVGEEADFAGVDVDGKIAVVDRGIVEFRVKAANAQTAGAVALIVVDARGERGFAGTFGAYVSDIPVLLIRVEDGIRLRARLGQSLTVPEAQPLTGASQNVIARKSGGVCRVVVGGHYDTVPAVDGANDNASGTALTLAFAELWAGHPGSSDICFVLFGAEEMGLHGSGEYVRQSIASGSLEEVTAMLNLDAIGDGRPPYRIVVSAELRDLADLIASEVQIPAGLGRLPMEVGSDHASFASVEIPVVFVFAPGAILHVPADNLDNFNEGLYEDISRFNHAMLACLLLRAGSSITPLVPCTERTP